MKSKKLNLQTQGVPVKPSAMPIQQMIDSQSLRDGKKAATMKISFQTVAVGALAAVFYALNQVQLPYKNMVLKKVVSTLTAGIAADANNVHSYDHVLIIQSPGIGDHLVVGFAAVPAGTVDAPVFQNSQRILVKGGNVVPFEMIPMVLAQAGVIITVQNLDGAMAPVVAIGDTITYTLDMYCEWTP